MCRIAATLTDKICSKINTAAGECPIWCPIPDWCRFEPDSTLRQPPLPLLAAHPEPVRGFDQGPFGNCSGLGSGEDVRTGLAPLASCSRTSARARCGTPAIGPRRFIRFGGSSMTGADAGGVRRFGLRGGGGSLGQRRNLPTSRSATGLLCAASTSIFTGTTRSPSVTVAPRAQSSAAARHHLLLPLSDDLNELLKRHETPGASGDGAG